MRPVLSFDIGSTYTKGALFDLEPDSPRLVRRDALPTTIYDLAVGFSALHQRLLEDFPQDMQVLAEEQIPIYACSSAKGGLAIAALGIVPDLTLHAARLAAASAGGRIVATYSYRLAEEQIVELELSPPDVILLAGGTDGGNEDYVLHNARMLAESRLNPVVLYAGNAALRGEVRRILGDSELFITDNIMPEVGKLHIEPARAQIQEIFLKKIVEGRGLTAICTLCSGQLKPTPRAVFDLLGLLSEALPQWNDAMLVDLGGATTDLYSCTESFRGEDGFVLKGIREPKLKRTVEGDLGLRISACSTWDIGRDHIRGHLEGSPFSEVDFSNYVTKVSRESDYLPQSNGEEFFDAVLAMECLYFSLRRHVGRIEESYTPNGKICLQQGKDLRGIKRWILTGGYLSRQPSNEICQTALAVAQRSAGRLQLLPTQVDFFADTQYLLPLLGNLVLDYPAQAARLADENLACI